MSLLAPASISDWLAPGSPAISRAIRRAASPGYEAWWQRCAAVGFCANPIQASAHDARHGGRVSVIIRCGNRRAAICPSCSELYAADTWQLVHAGAHGMPDTIAQRPQVFATLTAPGFGAVHTSSSGPGLPARTCHAPTGGPRRCRHGNPLWCNTIHQYGDPDIGQPLCGDCYDYTGHVLFNWHAPELWRRFTISLRRALTRHLRSISQNPDTVRVSFVKVAEYQRRAVVHYHTLIRLDPATDTTDGAAGESDLGVSAGELAGLVHQAAAGVSLTVANADTSATPGVRVLRFGAQIDTQPLHTDDQSEPRRGLARRVAGYLAKYTTKSVVEFRIAARRISPQAIAELGIAAHTRRILNTLKPP